MEILATILPWIAPPLIGAIIGYGTNRVAIKMIFRPHTAKYIFGVHLPFTPGIIPKSRRELAQAIANTVADDLLDPENIRHQLNRPEFRQSLRAWVSKQRAAMLATPFTSWPQDVSGLLANIATPVAGAIKRIIDQPETRQRIHDAIHEGIRNYMEQHRSARLVPPPVRRGAHNIVDAPIDQVIDDLSDKVTPQGILSLIKGSLPSDVSAIGELIELSPGTENEFDDWLTDRLASWLDGQAPDLVAMLDIRRIVQSHIENLDSQAVEAMVLEVAGKHLRWINYFGAALGFILGLTQLALRLIT